MLGDVAAARRLYLHALLLDPFDPALRRMRDDDVRSMPDVVRFEIEIDEEPEAWSAPAGVLLGVLPRQAPEEVPAVSPPAEALSPARHDALPHRRRFIEALVAAGSREARRSSAFAVR